MDVSARNIQFRIGFSHYLYTTLDLQNVHSECVRSLMMAMANSLLDYCNLLHVLPLCGSLLYVRSKFSVIYDIMLATSEKLSNKHGWKIFILD